MRILQIFIACLIFGYGLLGAAEYPTGKLVLADYMPHHATRPNGNGLDVWRRDGNALASQASVKRRISNGDLIGSDGRNEIPCTVYPAVGMQSEEDDDYIEYQILLAKAARIDGFMIEWNGPGKVSNLRLRAVAERLGFFIGAIWQADQTLDFYVTPVYGANPSTTQWDTFLADYAARLRDELYEQPTAPKIGGRPLLLFFGWGCPAYNAVDLATIRAAWNSKPSPLFARTFLGLPDAFAAGNFRQGENLMDGYYPWSTPGSALSEPQSTDPELAPLIAANTHDSYYTAESMLAYRQRWIGYTKTFESQGFPLRMGGVMGHGDNRPCGGWGTKLFYVARKDGETARQQWNLYKNERANLDVIFIATWNDWTEGTIVEPSVERGLQDVTIIEEGASGFKDVASDSSGLPLPSRLFNLRKGYARLVRLGFPAAGVKIRLDAIAEQIASRRYPAAETAIAQEEGRLAALDPQITSLPSVVTTLVPASTEKVATTSTPIWLNLPSAVDVLLSSLRCDAELTWEWFDADFSSYQIYSNSSGTASSDALAEIICSGTGQWKTAKIRVYDKNCWFTRDTISGAGKAVLKVTGNVKFRNMVLTATQRNLPPVISIGPTSASVNAGTAFSLSLEAGGTGTLAYQWRKNGSAIQGGTGASLEFTETWASDGGTYDCVVSIGSLNAVSSSAVVRVVELPAVELHPSATLVNLGASTTLSVIANGTPPLFYQWTKDGVSITGGTATSYTIMDAKTSDAGIYSATISNDAGSVVSRTAVVGVNIPPLISHHPDSLILNETSSATFTVTASGTIPLTYQWRKDGVAILGGTQATYTLPSIYALDVGTYDVVITNVAGSATSATATLAVNTAPVINTQPVSLKVNAGTVATFAVTANGTTPLSYQWRKDGVSITGGTQATYTLNPVQALDAGAYDVVITNVAGSATSATATLAVNTAPVINTQPVSLTVNAGTVATFAVTANGTTPLSYQWRKDGVSITGGTQATYTLNPVQALDAGAYDVVITNDAGSATSATATLAVNTAPVINTQPVSLTVNAGTVATFAVIASGTAPLSYQWRKDGVSVTGGTQATYTLNSVQALNAGAYDVVITNAAGSATSATATLAVNTAPVINTQPVSLTVNAGTVATFAVIANGTAPLSYQWRKDGVAITGGTQATYTLNPVQALNAGAYDVVITNAAGSATSATATLAVNTAPVINTQPVSLTVNAGTVATFAVIANGTAPLSYQWRKGGVAITGGTQATYTLNSVQALNAGTYDVVITNAAGSATSATATLAVNTAPVINTQPVSLTVNAGTVATFAVIANGTAPLSYQWRKGGVAITGGTQATYTLNSVQALNAGTYDVVITNAAGSATSATATLAVNTAPVINTQPVSLTVNAGTVATFAVIASGAAPLNYQWRKGGVAIKGGTQATYTLNSVQVLNAGTYDVIVKNASGSVISVTATLTVNTAPVIKTQPVSLTVNEGTVATFAVTASGTMPLSYQWRKGSVAILGGTQATYTLNPVQSVNAGTYDVVVRNASGSVISGTASLAVNTAPVINTQPVSLTIKEGTGAAFAVTANGTAPLMYQWRKGGVAITGGTQATYTLNSVQPLNAGTYDVIIKNVVGSVTSATATLAVNTAPVIKAQPVSLTVNEGTAATFAVTASGTAPLSYQWRKGGVAITGGTAATYTFNPVQALNEDTYDVVVSNVAGSVTSTPAVLSVISSSVVQYLWSTLAGRAPGNANGTGIEARFNQPHAAAVDASGNIFVADTNNHTIRKISSSGEVITFAGMPGISGSADGAGAQASFNTPAGIALSASGTLYVSDSGNHTIRIITPTGAVTTLAGSAGFFGTSDGSALRARFHTPQGLAVDTSGNLFVCDADNSTVRKISATGAVTTYASRAGYKGSVDGAGSNARFKNPKGITADKLGNFYVADSEDNTIRKITARGEVSTLAGMTGARSGWSDGSKTNARFFYPSSLALDAAGTTLFVTDSENAAIRKVSTSGLVTTLAGGSMRHGYVDGPLATARFDFPAGIALDPQGDVYITDRVTDTIRKIIISTGSVATVAGTPSAGATDGDTSSALFHGVQGLALDAAGTLYIVDGGNHTIRKITGSGSVTTFAGLARSAGNADGNGTAARFNHPEGIFLSAGTVYISDTGNQTIRKISANGAVSTLAGLAGTGGNADGSGTRARFNQPQGLAIDGNGNLHVSDNLNHTIRKITPSGVVSTLAGTVSKAGFQNGPAHSARFNGPSGMVFDKSGNLLLADTNNQLIRKLTPSGLVSTYAGAPAVEGDTDATLDLARFSYPEAITMDAKGNFYVVDTENHTVRKISRSGMVSTIGGTPGLSGSTDGVGGNARFCFPRAIVVDGNGKVYVTDGYNNVIRIGTPVSDP